MSNTSFASRAKSAGTWLLRAFALLLVAGSLMSTSDFNQWWIRIWDFPRIQILVAMVLAALALWAFDKAWQPWLPIALAIASVWQLYRILPYTPLSPAEVAHVSKDASEVQGCFSLLTLNVLQDNRDYARTNSLIKRVNPDLILLTETDQAWIDALEPVLAGYAGRIERPLDNKYGILLATRLPMSNASIQDLAQADTPSVFATLEADGNRFRMIGLHPRPPRPDQDTEERDAEIVMAAKDSQALGMPVLALGDFNDVAWSDTTRLFKDIGGFLDPRVGRGTYATFPAGMVWLGWPLDHLFVTEEFLLDDIRVGESVGSDHRPVVARLCLDPDAAKALNEDAEPTSAESEEDAADVMDDYQEDAAEDRAAGDAG